MKWVGIIFLLLGIIIIGALVFAGYTIVPPSSSGVNTFPSPQLVTLVAGGLLILIGVVLIFKR
jgi:hypothetical protein